VSLADFLEELAPTFVDERLVAKPQLRSCLGAARHFPDAAMLGLIGLEIYLKSDRPADLLVCATRGQKGPAWLARLIRDGSEQERPIIGEGLTRLAEEWVRTSGSLAGMDCLWLEVDSPSRSAVGGESIRRASVFFGSTAAGLSSMWTPQGTVEEAVSMICGGKALSGALLTSRLLSARLERPAWICQVGVMLSRGEPAELRLCILCPDVSVHGRLLSILGVGEDTRMRAAELLTELGPGLAYLAIDVDASAGGIRDRLGLEMYPIRLDEPMTPAAWVRLVDGLVRLQLCTAQEGAGLLSYPRVSRGFEDLLSRLTKSTRRNELLGSRVGNVFVAGIHHVKVTVPPRGRMSAKAYLAIWRDRQLRATTTPLH
jgi:hypothetical protein